MRRAAHQESLVVGPGKLPRTVVTEQGDVLSVPDNWDLLPPGDAGLTRRVKAAGPSWTVQVRKGRKLFSQGVWADAAIIQAKRDELEAERSTEAYSKRRAADGIRREKAQLDYVQEFESAVVDFLNFHPMYEKVGKQLAKVVAIHATPVGSGTVARTKMIPVERRAEAAVIAWMRHQTTAYDHMKIPRVKGERREVRRMLAQRSRQLLDAYRRGLAIADNTCPLQSALHRLSSTSL